jgi:hypothetical protein
VRRRLLDLCLLAYPRLTLERDREYLRDLALELAAQQGLLRQAWSLLRGGVRERIEATRRRRGGPGAWARRAAIGSLALAALFAGAGLFVADQGGAETRHEVEVLTCVTDEAGARDCTDVNAATARRTRAGWECTTRRLAHGGLVEITSTCTREGELVARVAP